MDVDIDIDSAIKPGILFGWPKACVFKDGVISPHVCGYYPQDIPVDPITGFAAMPYETAESAGFLKLDFLNLSIYKSITRAEIDAFIEKEPDWSLLLLPSTHQKLFQLSEHGELLTKIKPKSVEELSDVMALIRPGKSAFLGLYENDKESARKLLFSPNSSGYSFKKSHSIAYALVVVLQLHLIECNRL